jgi:hypothetical protein
MQGYVAINAKRWLRHPASPTPAAHRAARCVREEPFLDHDGTRLSACLVHHQGRPEARLHRDGSAGRGSWQRKWRSAFRRQRSSAPYRSVHNPRHAPDGGRGKRPIRETMLRPTSQESSPCNRRSNHSKAKTRPISSGAGFPDAEAGLLVIAGETNGEVGQDQAQKADAAVDGLGQRRRSDDAATKELESAGSDGQRKQAKAFIVEVTVDQIIEFGIAVNRNTGGRVAQDLGGDARALKEQIGVTACVAETCQHPPEQRQWPLWRAPAAVVRWRWLRHLWQSSHGMSLASRKAVY